MLHNALMAALGILAFGPTIWPLLKRAFVAICLAIGSF